MGIGETLREARLQRGLEIADCESATKIRGKYLRALEEEQYDLMPGATFVRGFLRTYADQLGLDSRVLVDAYDAEHVPAREPTVFEEALRRSRSRRRSRESRFLAAVTVLALAIGGAVWTVFDGPRAEAADSGRPVTAVFASAGRQATYVEARQGSDTGPALFAPSNISPDNPVTVTTQLPIDVHVGDGSGLALSIDGVSITIPSGATDFVVRTDGALALRDPNP